jgi:hypothetical protein
VGDEENENVKGPATDIRSVIEFLLDSNLEEKRALDDYLDDLGLNVRKLKTILSRNDPQYESLLYQVSENLQSLWNRGVWDDSRKGYDNIFRKSEDISMSFRESLLQSILGSEFNRESTEKEKVDFYSVYFDSFNKRSLPGLDRKLNGITNSDLIRIYTSLPEQQDIPLISDDFSVEKERGRNFVQSLESDSDRPSDDDTTGDGIRRDKPWIKIGSSAANPSLRNGERLIDGKYILNDNLLTGSGILELRHAKNRHLTNLKPMHVSQPVRKIVKDETGIGTLDTRDYKTLHEQEKHLVRQILNKFKKSHLLDENTDNFQEDFEVLVGSWKAGNNSNLLRQQLRDVIAYWMKTSRIPRNVAIDMILELGI